jgi:hypothetical protein
VHPIEKYIYPYPTIHEKQYAHTTQERTGFGTERDQYWF